MTRFRFLNQLLFFFAFHKTLGHRPSISVSRQKREKRCRWLCPPLGTPPSPGPPRTERGGVANRYLRSIDLSDNSVGDRGCLAVADALASSGCCLTSVNLAVNRIEVADRSPMVARCWGRGWRRPEPW